MLAECPLHIFQLFLNSFPLDNLAREFLSARFDPPALQFHRSNRKSDGQSRKQETTEREKVVSSKVVKIKRISRGNKKPVCRQIGKNRGHDGRPESAEPRRNSNGCKVKGVPVLISQYRIGRHADCCAQRNARDTDTVARQNGLAPLADDP